MAKSYLYAVHNNNILVLELKAILESVIYVKKNHKVRRVDIFFDSEDALTQLQSPFKWPEPITRWQLRQIFCWENNKGNKKGGLVDRGAYAQGESPLVSLG